MTVQARDYVGTLDDSQRAKLTTMIMEERRKTGQIPVVTPKLIEDAKHAEPLTVAMRAERLLRYLVNKLQPVGQPFNNQMIIEAPDSSAWSESTSPTEVQFFVDYLATRGWLKKISHYFFMITVDGYEHVAEQSRKKDLSQCFVAMWFHPEIDTAYKEGIEKAIKECGYTCRRIDQKQHLNKICDEAIAEIRRSRFMVADFTHGADGARGSVFYEAGFAHALGLPVIFSCQKDQEKSLHFDTRQYPHILWEKPEDLYAQLREKIGALIGDYKGQPAPL